MSEKIKYLLARAIVLSVTISILTYMIASSGLVVSLIVVGGALYIASFMWAIKYLHKRDNLNKQKQ